MCSKYDAHSIRNTTERTDVIILQIKLNKNNVFLSSHNFCTSTPNLKLEMTIFIMLIEWEDSQSDPKADIACGDKNWPL